MWLFLWEKRVLFSAGGIGLTERTEKWYADKHEAALNDCRKGMICIKIEKATSADVKAAFSLMMKLWPGGDAAERTAEMEQMVAGPEAAILLAWEEERAVGYAQCQLRHDYVEGCASSPVGYLEGIYVEGEYRGKGVDAAFLEACHQWSRSMGCTEFASDCELEIEANLHFHLKNGFEEANRIICFVKRL